MENRYRLVVVILFFLFMASFVIAIPAKAEIIVGSGGDYSTIQEAVDEASDGDTIIVKNGTYNENIVVDKQLTIQSETGNVNTFVIAEYPADNVFYVTADNVTIKDFTIYGASDPYKAGILLLDVDNCTVSNNRCCGDEVGKENYYGVVFTGATNCTVNNNECSENSDTGMIVDADDSQVYDNLCESNPISGISVSGQRNLIENNNCSENGHGLRLLGSNSTVKKNYCSENLFSGIYCSYIENYTIYYNRCSLNMNYGIKLEHADNNLIILNDFSSNSSSNVYSSSSVNIFNSWESPLTIWYGYDRLGTLDPPYFRSYMGNYYSDHGFSDVAEDGICDSSYILPGNEPSDDFPLFEAVVNYGMDIDCDWDAVIISSEDLLVLGDLVIGSNGTGSLTIEGSLTLGSI